MDKRIIKWFRRVRIGRTTIMALLFLTMSFFLIHRIYDLQIINGAEYRNNFSLQTTRTRTLKATRGNIYDRNGSILAYNELSYSLTLTDAGTYETRRAKALYLNGEAYRISQILKSHGDALSNDFHIVLGEESGDYEFDVTGVSLLRFKADVYGQAYTDDLKEEQANASAAEMMKYLISENGYAIIRENKPYTEEEFLANGLPVELTKQDILDIVYVRYQLFTTSFRKYVPVTIATNLSDESVADLMEQKATLTGIDIVEDTIRVYDSPEAFASLIGYTGRVSAEDLSELQAVNSSYTSTSIVGKSGIEKIMETSLQGFDGEETVYVDNLGKVLKVDEEATINPRAGNNIYLTIDKNLQVAVYHMLEQRIAGILETNIIDAKEFDASETTDTAEIKIPIYDVFFAFFNNNILDMDHFTADDASETERTLAAALETKQGEVFAALNEQLTGSDPLPYNALTDEMKEYESYIVNTLLMSKTKILNSSAIDRQDATFLAWTRDESISLKEYLTYAASRNWIDITAFTTDDTYLDSSEIYDLLSEYIKEYLSTDKDFSKKLYKYLLLDDRISGSQLVRILYDQGVFSTDDGIYESFIGGDMKVFDLVLLKIHNLVLTPAMLALDPCSGSAVVTDPQTGETLACVTYPGYDNNRLSNNMDVAYYNALAADLSRPFYNKATQQTTAPGSTFKPVTAAAGLEEKVIDRSTNFKCTGIFDLIETPLRCWYHEGHGDLNIVEAIENSCNVFFSNVAYLLGTTEEKEWSDSLSLGKIQSYARLFDLDENSGLELNEATPQVTDQYAIPSSIGQGTHSYTTTQLARYISTIANSGTSYEISLIDRVTDTDDNVVEDYSSAIASKINMSDETWSVIHEGLRAVIVDKDEFIEFGVDVAGKTGTAQESKSRPSHALFVGYAPSDSPEIALAIRIGNGYSSTNAMLLGKDIFEYYFQLRPETELVVGTATGAATSNTQTD